MLEDDTVIAKFEILRSAEARNLYLVLSTEAPIAEIISQFAGNGYYADQLIYFLLSVI